MYSNRELVNREIFENARGIIKNNNKEQRILSFPLSYQVHCMYNIPNSD